MREHSSVDLDEYLHALPVRQLFPPQRDVPTRYAAPGWPLLKSFNGFSGAERRRGGQLVAWLLAAGCLAKPEQCDICASRSQLGFHGENYYDLRCYPVLCRSCHHALHLRAYQWDAWRRIVDAAATTGSEWFVLGPRHGFDLAQHLRDKFGWSVADIERSALSPLSEAIKARLPTDMWLHPYLHPQPTCG